MNTQTPTLDFTEVLTPLLSRLGFEEGFFTKEEEEEEEEATEDDFFPPAEGIAPLEEDDDEEDFILLISTIKALARFLTMASRSGGFDLSRESRQTEVEITYKI